MTTKQIHQDTMTMDDLVAQNNGIGNAPQVPVVATFDLLVYLFAFSSLAAANMFAKEMGIKWLLIVSSVVRNLAVVFLCVNIVNKRVLYGLSFGTIQLYIIGFVANLTAITLGKEDLAEDITGEWYFYLNEFSISLILFWVASFLVRLKQGTQEHRDKEWKNVCSLVLCSGLAASFSYPDFCSNWMVCYLWMFSLYVQSIATVPQIMLTTRYKQNRSQSWYFLALIFLANSFALFYWWKMYAQFEVLPGTCALIANAIETLCIVVLIVYQFNVNSFSKETDYEQV